jgi:hypothetical protein
MKRLICVAALAASAALAQDAGPADKAAAPADTSAAAADKAAAPAAEMPKPPEEMSIERWFVGRWNCKGQQYAGPMGPEMKVSSRLEMTLELGGFWLQIKGTATSGPMKGKQTFDSFASFDGSQHQRYNFQPGGMSRLSSKGWDGNDLVFEGEGMLGGQKMLLRHTITKKGENEFGSLFESDGKTMSDLTCTRAGGARK